MYGRVVPTMPIGELYVQGNQGHSPGIEPPLMTTEDYYSLRWAVYVSYLISSSCHFGHEATDTGFAYAPVSQAHRHHHSFECFALLHCSADQFCTTPGGF